MTRVYELKLDAEELAGQEREQIEREKTADAKEKNRNSAIKKLEKLGLTQQEIEAFFI